MNSLGGKKALPVASAIASYLKLSHLSSGMNTHLVFAAWNKVTGAGDYTLKKFYKDGKLYVTMSSSVMASHLIIQRDILVRRMNEYLEENTLFTKDDPNVGFIKELKIR